MMNHDGSSSNPPPRAPDRSAGFSGPAKTAPYPARPLAPDNGGTVRRIPTVGEHKIAGAEGTPWPNFLRDDASPGRAARKERF